MPINLDALIDPHAQLPKYRQLAARLREAIDDGRLQAGEELPSDGELATATGMSRDSVLKAMALLLADALIVRTQGAATTVAPSPPQRPMDASRYLKALRILKAGGPLPLTSSFTEDHNIPWADYKVETTVAREAATAEDARRLHIPVGTDILRRTFLKYGAGVPLQIQRSAMTWDLAGGTPVADPGQQPWPLGTIAELFSLGLEVTKVAEDTRTRMPRDEERRALNMQTPGPVFDIVRVFWVGERAVEASRVIAPGSRTALHYEVELDLSGE
jgi:DNA-binding GntR family transcriptional regulator